MFLPFDHGLECSDGRSPCFPRFVTIIVFLVVVFFFAFIVIFILVIKIFIFVAVVIFVLVP